MIRRISKVNDLKDIIKSCPSGVIDDITSIKYFIQGHPETEIEAEFEKVGTHLEAILPTSALETLSNGILMRRALYKVEDSSYPDGYYNLEFLDDMNVWLGDEETEDPFDPGYLTEGDLKTINGESLVGVGNIDVVNYIPDYYATKSWVSEQGYLTSHQDLTGYATESWVSSNFLSTTALTGYATEIWVEAQGYITSTGLSGLATQSWVLSQNYLNSQSLTGYATEDWVTSNIRNFVTEENVLNILSVNSYITESWVSSQQFATQSWVSGQGYLTSHQDLTGYATESWVSSNYVSTITLSSYTTFSDIDSYISSFWNRAAEEFYIQYVPRSQVGSYLTGYATESWVSSQQFATQSWVSAQGYLTSHQDLTGYATESWVSSQQFATQSWVSGQGYLTSVPSEYATQSWVLSQNYLNSQSLTGYATESWVSSQQFATQSWATSEFLEESKVWTGTQSQWEALTPAQQAGYTIALITE